MANKILNLIFKADAKQATQELKKLQGTPGTGVSGGTGIAGVAAAVSGVIGPATIAAGAVLGVGAVIKGQLDAVSDYVTEVGNLASSLGITTSEASFLKDAMIRYGITNDTMVAVFRKLASEGIDPTVKNLGDLLAEWEAMPEGAKKGQFAMEYFGEQGIKQLLPWWDKLTKAEKDAFGEAGSYLDVTDDVIKRTAEYESAVADLKLAWTGVKIELLTGVMPAITSILTETLKALKAVGGLLSGRTQAQLPFTIDNPNLFGYQPPALSADRRAGGVGHAAGGSFVVGGSGGSDTTPVGFMATPGETVSIGGGTNDMENILSEVRRLVDSLPLAISDAVERR